MESWVKADPEREKQIEQLYEIWKESGKLPYNLNTDEAWSRLVLSMDKIALDTHANRLKESGNLYIYTSSKRFRRVGVVARRVALVAATVLIVMTAGLLTLHNQSVQEAGMAEVENRVIMTKEGERASYMLSDGSKVVLHAGSRLEIPENYNSENRELYLEGEAYFETAHNPDKPFIVRSESTYTQVVGTRFLVQAWAGSEQKVEVIVSEGKVLFGNRPTGGSMNVSKEVLLSQNQRGVISNQADPVIDDITDMEWYLGWTEGRLVFENRPLSEVFPRLERWYNIDIRFTDERIAAQKITADIDYSLPMSDVLEGMAMSLGMELEKEGRTVTFQKLIEY